MDESSSRPSGPGRPLPVFADDVVESTKPSDRNFQADEDSDSGRQHTSSSLPRTKFTTRTPSSEREAISKLKQRMTFSDHSAESSTRSTPTKNTNLSLSLARTRGAASDPTSKRATSFVGASNMVTKSYVQDEEKDECVSEGEITSAVSISDILSKLDSVKNYLKEAEALHRMMQDKMDEPGAQAQIEKLTKLIQELRQQESSYLAIILRMLDYGKSHDPMDAAQNDSEESEEEGSEYSEDESGNDEDNDPADETITKADQDGSLSLRAQLSEDPDQEEEIRVLQHQQQMLRDLIEQQKKIQDLEEKQAELLRRREQAQNQLLDAEARTQRYQRLQEEALAQQQQQSEITDNEPPVTAGNDVNTLEDSLQLEKHKNDEALERQQLLLARITALKARKDKVEGMLNSLGTLQISEGPDDGEDAEQDPARETSSSSLVDQEERTSGASEFVNTTDLINDPRMTEVEDRLRQAAEAKKKLAELRQMIDFMKGSVGDEFYPSDADPPTQQPSETLKWRFNVDADTREDPQVGVASEDEDGDEEANGSQDMTLNESRGGMLLDQGLVADYQMRLSEKRREVATLQRQKEELQQMQEKLLAMKDLEDIASFDMHAGAEGEGGSQSLGVFCDNTDDGDLPLRLKDELRKQKHLYDEIMSKTRKLQDLQTYGGAKNSEHDTYSLTSSTRQLTEADLTAATWGGSTVQSDEEDSDDSASAVSPVPAQSITTKEPQQAMAGSSSVKQSYAEVGPEERLNFTVTRHTPRPCSLQRTLETSDESPQNVGKRMRMESEESVSASQSLGATGSGSKSASSQVPPISHLSAVWPGVIFPSLGRKASKDTSTQTTTHPPTSVHAASPNPGADIAESPTPTVLESSANNSSLVQSQLNLMTNMCSELLHGQNSLISALCHRLDNAEARVTTHEHMNQLHDYHSQLQLYYEDMCQAHTQLASPRQLESQGPQSELEDPINAQPGTDSDLEGQYPVTTSMPELSTATQSQGQMPPSNQFYDAGGMAAFGYSPLPKRSVFTSASHAPFASHGYNNVPESDQLPHLPVPRPPPPLPLFMAHPTYAGVQSPYCPARPVCQPGWHSHPSPVNYPDLYGPYHVPYSSPYPVHSHMSNAVSGGAPHGYYQAQSYYGPNTCSPQVDPRAFPSQENRATSFSQAYPLTPSNLREALHPSNLPFPLHVHPMEVQPKANDSVLNSPSGVTAASIQVEAPTSPPPSAPPSINLQPRSDNINSNNSNTEHLVTVTGVASSTASILQTQSERFSLPDVPTSESASQGFGLSVSAPSMLPPRSSYDDLSTMFIRQEDKATDFARQENVKTEFEEETEDERSISSLPLSAPGDYQVYQPTSSLQEQAQSSEQQPAGFPVFDALRDTIYSEVASLIASNESRPHFLVELFRELQLLSSDYLRQRALYNIQDLVTKFLTEEAELDRKATPTRADQFQYRVGPFAEHAPSESEVTTEGSAPTLPTSNSTTDAFDYVELVASASSLSTPRSTENQPFASDDLGNTVIHFDKTKTKARQSAEDVGASPRLNPPAMSPRLVTKEEGDDDEANLDASLIAEYQAMGNLEFDAHEQIKDVMTEVIPILKANMNSECTGQLLDQIKTTILELVLDQESKRNPDFQDILTKQLYTTITTALEKYTNKKFQECGEDMLVDLSEVLFNELSFFRLMLDLRDHPQLSSDFKSVTSSQTTTENEDYDDTQVMRAKPLPMDPILLQALSLEVGRKLVEEDDALGNVRDDELASMWDPRVQVHDQSMSGEDDHSNIAETPLTETMSEQSSDQDDGLDYHVVDSSEPPVARKPAQGQPLPSIEQLSPSVTTGPATDGPVALSLPTPQTDPPPAENLCEDAPLVTADNDHTDRLTEDVVPEESASKNESDTTEGIVLEESASKNESDTTEGIVLEDSTSKNESDTTEGIVLEDSTSKNESAVNPDSTQLSLVTESSEVLAHKSVGNKEDDIGPVEGIHGEGASEHQASSPPGSLGTPQDIQVNAKEEGVKGTPTIVVSTQENVAELAESGNVELPVH